MSWIPHFDNWQSGLLAAALAIPALLVLYFLKLRRKEMPVSSTFLWKKAIQDLQVNAPFQKLRRNLLLLLQLLLLFAILLALARPVANYRPGAGKQTVILIDRSASMSAKDVDGHSRLDEAKRRAKELVDSMKRGATGMVIAFDDSAETIQAMTSDASALRSAIDRIQPTDRKTKLKLAYQLAEAQANFNPDQYRPNTEPPDIRLYSDGRISDGDELPTIHGQLFFEKIGSDNAKNIAIVSLNAKRNYERPAQVQVFARLANFGPEPVDAPVQLSVDGEVIALAGSKTRSTFLLPDRWDSTQRDAWDHAHPDKPGVDSVDFELELTTAAVLKLEQLNKDGDALAVDDSAQLVVPPPKSLAVLLVTDGNYFLERAINSLGLKAPDTIRPDIYEDKKPDKYDVIIFDRYKPTYLPSAGNFIYFLDGPRAALPDMKLKVAKGADGRPILLTDVGVLDWKREHAILKDLALSKLYIAQAVKLDVPPEDEVLIDGLKGPLVVMDHTLRATNLVVAFDCLQSNWPLKVSFPIFLHNALQYLAIGSDMDVRQGLSPGSTPTIPRANLQKIGDPKSIKLKGPDGTQTIRVPDAGDFVLPALNHTGLYETDPPVPQFEKIAVNLLDATESNLLPADRAPGDMNAPVEAQKTTRARLELWWWLLAVLALPLLMIEWWVYTRRVHL
ncbi:MAG TPA: VWA domain-containing protein [Tepidisphaeraceae bacterium]|jgi:hypothetical protein|nr:VWA domain-containing protein [Tepidisphaeraceae bacterium]